MMSKDGAGYAAGLRVRPLARHMAPARHSTAQVFILPLTPSTALRRPALQSTAKPGRHNAATL